jgi:PTS system nitrogen regulatory IIA component
MDLVTLLSPGAVRILSGIGSKKRLFQELGEMFAGSSGTEAGVASDALQERESLGPTGVGSGIALPHARLAGLSEVRGVFVRLEKPLDFDAVDRQPVDLIFALFAPEDSGVDHLKALALVSRTMRNASLCSKLRANDDPATLYAILTDKQATRAA